MKKLMLVFISVVLSAGVLAASNGANNGKPFQEIQAAVDAAIAAEAGAREAADAAEAAAREAADTAEASTRAAEDAALAAADAAEEAARIAADMMFMQQLEIEIAERQALGGVVSILAGFHGRALTYTETSGVDLGDLPDEIASLGYQLGEWVAFATRNALTGIETAVCSNHPNMASFIDAAPPGVGYTAEFFDPDGFLNIGGTGWIEGAPIRLQAGFSGLMFLRHPYTNLYWMALLPGNAAGPEFEVRAGVTGLGLGYGIGNIFTISVAPTREVACGF